MSFRARFKAAIRTTVQVIAPRIAVSRAINGSPHQEPEVSMLEALVDPSRAAVDVGGHLGAYTHRLVSLAPKVIVFEANPRLATVLAQAFPNASVRNEAVSDVDGMATLKIPLFEGATADGLASLESQPTGEVREIEIKTVQLDSLEGEIGFLKIDVEGHEVNVLNGARRLVQRCRPVVLVEVEDRHRAGAVSEVMRYFEAYGYDGLFVFGSDVLPISEFGLDMQDPDKVVSNLRADGVFANNFMFFPKEALTPEKRAEVADIRRRTAPPTARSSASAISQLRSA